MAYIKVAVNRLRKGMIVGEDVYTKTGVILVTQGSPASSKGWYPGSSNQGVGRIG